MNNKKRLYIVASPFQFFGALLYSYEVKDAENAYFILLRHSNNNIDYCHILTQLNIEYIEFVEYNIEGSTVYTQEKKRFLSKLTRKYYELKKARQLTLQIKKKDNILQDKVYVGEHTHPYSRIIASYISNNICTTGDGAGIVWGEGNYSFFKQLEFLIMKMIGIQSPIQLSKNIDRDLFKKPWQFISDFYNGLPIKDEVWIFGSSAPFVEPYSMNVYSKVARKYYENKENVITKDIYFEQLKEIVDFFPSIPSLYFPHRSETIEDRHKELVAISEHKVFAEVLPLILGYLPKYIVGTSTTIFSFSNIKQNTKQEINLYFTPVMDEIDEIYRSYGAIEFPFSKI